MMKVAVVVRLPLLSLLAGLAAGCTTDLTTGAANLDQPAFSAAAGRVAVCHRNDDGGYTRITVSSNAVSAHIAHGDALPGAAVPGTSDSVFDDDCVPQAAGPAPDLSGTWAGMLHWDCGGGHAGSAGIRLALTQEPWGELHGTAHVLDVDVGVTGNRTANFVETSGTPRIRDPEGDYASLGWDRIDGVIAGNLLSGEISPDGSTIGGWILNGHTSPAPGVLGCSANFGPSGSFEISRVN